MYTFKHRGIRTTELIVPSDVAVILDHHGHDQNPAGRLRL
jgi:hypothetical protein